MIQRQEQAKQNVLAVLMAKYSFPEREEKLKLYIEEFKSLKISLEKPLYSQVTALICAAKINHPRCLKLLLDEGSKIDAKDSNGDTALHWAAFIGCHDSVQILIEAKANLNMINHMYETPLHCAVVRKNPDCLKLLIAAGAKIVLPSLKILPLSKILAVINMCPPRDYTVQVALARICEQHLAFSELNKNLYGLKEHELIETINVIKEWNELCNIYKKCASIHMDTATYGYLPAVIIDLILQYDCDCNQVPLDIPSPGKKPGCAIN